MKKGIRDFALWIVLIIIAVVVIASVKANGSTQMNYSELVNSIAAEKVEKIVLSSEGTSAEVTLVDENVKKEVTIPSVDNLMEQINEKMVAGNIQLEQEETSIIVALLSVLSPIIILIVFLVCYILFK